MTTDWIGTASGFEILWLASAAVGVAFSRRNWREAWGDYRATGGLVNGRRAIAQATLVAETTTLSIHSMYILIGVVAATIPSPAAPTAAGILIQSVLVGTSWGLTLISVVNRKLRRYLVEVGMQPRAPNGKFTR